MKVNQIVSEHKKGVLAKKYTKKTKGTVPVYGPEANDGKLKPVKPVGTMKEAATIKAIEPGKMATIDDPEHGKTINLDLTKPENAASLKPNDKGEIEYDATPDMGAVGAGNTESPLKPGAVVTIKADENHGDIGGDPTDDFIDDVTDHEYGQEGDMEEAIFGIGNKSPEEWAQTSKQMATLLQFRDKYKGTPYADQIEQRIKFLKDRLDVEGSEVAGQGGSPKPVVPPEQFNTKQLREAASKKDDELLNKMLTIAGLK